MTFTQVAPDPRREKFVLNVVPPHSNWPSGNPAARFERSYLLQNDKRDGSTAAFADSRAFLEAALFSSSSSASFSGVYAME